MSVEEMAARRFNPNGLPRKHPDYLREHRQALRKWHIGEMCEWWKPGPDGEMAPFRFVCDACGAPGFNPQDYTCLLDFWPERSPSLQVMMRSAGESALSAIHAVWSESELICADCRRYRRARTGSRRGRTNQRLRQRLDEAIDLLERNGYAVTRK